MKYISIDIETTGLDKTACQILSVGLVIEDTLNVLPCEDLPKLELRIKIEKLSGDIFALNMNKDLIEDILNQTYRADYAHYVDKESVVQQIYYFLKVNNVVNTPGERINVAGKNFTGFDLTFLELLPDWGKPFRVCRRTLDPAIFAVDWEFDDSLPNLDECKKRMNIAGVVTHNAVEDAMDVIKVIRVATKNYTTSIKVI